MNEYNKKEATIAIVRGVVPVVVMFLTMAGISADADIIITFVGAAIALVTFIWSWWKNNNITQAAQQAQTFLNELKETGDGRIQG